MELPVAPAQATTVETSEETLVTGPIFVALGDDPEAVVVGEMIVAIGVEKQSAIIGVHERKEHRRSVTTGAVIEIDGNGMRLSEDVANHHPLGEVAHQAIAVASPRDSRDGPSSIGSPSSETTPAFRATYGRGRGVRGRGRGAYYDDFHGRNPSPDSNWNRRAQHSATPPPQVPAFGSTSGNVSINTSNLKPPIAAALTPPTGPAIGSPIGGAVPIAPRSRGTKFARDTSKAVSNKWHNPEATSPRKTFAVVSKHGLDSGKFEAAGMVRLVESTPPQTGGNEIDRVSGDKHMSSESETIYVRRRRRPICGKRVTDIPSKESAESLENASDDSDADSVDSISRAEFLEGDLKQAEEEWSLIPRPLEEDDTPVPDDILQLYDAVEKDQDTDGEREEKLAFVKVLKEELYAEKLVALHPLQPAPELNALLLTPFIESSLNNPESMLFKARQSVANTFNENECIPTEGQAEGNVDVDQDTTPKAEDEELADSDLMSKPFAYSKDLVSRLEAQVSDLEPEAEFASLVRATVESQSLSDSRASVKANDEASAPPSANGRPVRSRPILDQFDKSEDELSGAEREEEYAAVHKMMQTPAPSSLPNFNCLPWNQDSDFLKTLDSNPAVEINLRKRKAERQARKDKEQEDERQLWKQRYYHYRRWTDFSDDAVAVRSREKFTKARAKAAADAAAASTSTPITGSKPEPQRRTGSRFATEHDIERILQESKQEAKESEDKEREKEREERDARAKDASAKEASIPDMYWDDEERLEHCFIDRTHLVSFERSFAMLEFGEPIDNFGEEECEIFEKIYLEMPKQWGKIAEALERRDYKACIQHYYLIKHSTNLKEKFKKQGKKKGRRAAVPKGAKPKSNALTVDIVKADDTEDGQDTENGSERRRPRRAAAPTFAFESTPGDAETQSSASASTPSRKSMAGVKGESSDAGPPKRRPKNPREKGTKQAKNGQLLAAAPPSTSRPSETPMTQQVSARLESLGQSRFSLQYDSAVGLATNFIPSTYTANDKVNASMTTEFDSMSQLSAQDRLESGTATYDGQDRRNMQQTSSYWSVPEQNDFPALLRHFGTDWHGIAKFMTSKTHIMVKNYYLRQVDSGRMSSWRDIAEEADEKRKRGEPTGPLPKPTMIPKRRIDGQTTTISRPGTSMEGIDDLTLVGQTMVLQQGSPSQATLSSRLPALAQAGPVPSALTSAANPAVILSKHLPQQSQPAPQQLQQPSRGPRGPALGYFNTDPQRPILQPSNAQGQSPAPVSDSVSQRSLMAAQEAHLERQQALRLEREQAAQAQVMQQQAMQRERQLQMKQESDTMNVHQYEQYTAPSVQVGSVGSLRSDAPNQARTAPPQQYQPRVRNIVSETSSIIRDLKSSPAPAIPRAPLSAPPASHEQYAAPPTQPTPAAPPRQEPARKSNIMSLLNDEPTDRAPPPKRVSDVSSTTLQQSQTPPPQHALQSSRYTSHPPPSTTQPHAPTSQQMPSHMTAQHQAPQSQHSYNQPSSYGTNQPSSSSGPARSYTPNNFESRSYAAQSTMPQQQPTYSQPSRQSLVSQPPRREPVLNDHHHGTTGAYSLGSTPSQSSMRIQESAYSATPPPSQQSSRPQATSPLDHAQQSDRDYYSRQSYQMQPQSATAGSPSLGPTYHSQSQQQSSHRQIAFGGTSHMASPPPQYSAQHPPHRSRRNSFDGRYPPAASSPQAPQAQGYTHAPQHQVTPLNPQYPTQHSSQDRYESSYERERRMQDEAYHHRRVDESRR
ncbi:hypothetical protein OIDMADRAFT_181500 [Oidiodendron maius Zn]|uniref:SANT domain-containing protein n=1 Tax=Oidiodendron maius (strain Zn) TaxID=913774 RepID=A0A0C3GSJ7_OIDMZ|nr:hypothetical protein OIDMADRAFT_181500 [Oidiodendron maius Zn]